jgi:hypothetical protein
MSDSALWKYTYPSPAMTLRQWYAGQVLAGLCAQDSLNGAPAEILAGWALEQADALNEAESKDASS